MSITLREKVESRQISLGKQNQADLLFWAEGTEDEVAIISAAESQLPAFVAGLVLQTYSVDHQGGGLWFIEARYGDMETKEAGDSSFSFDTSGTNTRITQSLQTSGAFALAGDAPDFKGAIGVTSDSVEGTEILIPQYSFSETHYVPIGLVGGAYKLALFNATGKVNSDGFRGFAAGEVLFLGASGSQRGQEDWEITFRFAASPNVSNLDVGGITVTEKKGWEYLWVRYMDDVDENVLVKKPVAVYVERVYEEASFSSLGIGS